MKLLREYIRIQLIEAMKTVEDLQPLRHTEYDEPLMVIANIRGRTAVFNITSEDAPDEPFLGGITLVKPSYPCGNAWMVGMVEAKQGWGPFLYDVAMEWATINGGGLTPDRNTVTGGARSVWDYYANNRGDVQAHQLDNTRGEITPGDDKDDCDMGSASINDYAVDVKDMETDWKTSPLSKRYTKAPTTIGKLKATHSWIER